MGPGGVGKTSVSAALAVAAASIGKKVLVLTLDPSKSLATAFGLMESAVHADFYASKDVYVPRQNFKGQIFASCIEARSIFNKLLKNTPAQKVQSNPIYKQTIANLQGSEEFSSIVKLVESVENYDLIVLDTPPMQESLGFLKAPEKFQKLFSSPLTKWLQKGGSHAAVQALSRITGADFIKKMTDFFSALAHIQPLIIEYSQKARQNLRLQTTAFVLVGGFDEIKVQQIEQLHAQLLDEGCQAKMLILNRLLNCAAGAAGSFSGYYQQQLEVGRQLAEKFPNHHLIQLPDLGKDICSLNDLKQLADKLR